MRISDWSSDVCSSDLAQRVEQLARARFVDAGHAFRRVANPFILKQRAERGGRLPQQLGAGVPDVLAADVLAVAAALYARELGRNEGDHRAVAGPVLVIAVAIFIAHHAPEGELARNDRDVGRALQPRGVEAAVPRPPLDAEHVEIGPLGPDRDRAAGRVLAEERSLRAAKTPALCAVETGRAPWRERGWKNGENP